MGEIQRTLIMAYYLRLFQMGRWVRALWQPVR